MVEPLVAPASTHVGGGSAKALSYVALRSHDGRRVLLPVAAAAGSRVLHGLFQGLSVMQLHQSVSHPTAATALATALTDAEAERETTAAAAQRNTERDEENAHSAQDQKEKDEEEEQKQKNINEAEDGGAAYHTYATTFPANMLCRPPAATSAAASSSPSSSASSSATLETTGGSTQLLEVPIRSLETSTLARVAEFLVVKCTLASHPHFLHEADVFGDLDRTSERDQLTAMQVLLGADFLNC